MPGEGYLEILNVWKEDGSEMISLERFCRAD